MSGVGLIVGLICFSPGLLSLYYLTDMLSDVLAGISWLLASISIAELRRQRTP